MTTSLTIPPDEDQAHPPRPPLKYDKTGGDLYNKGLIDERTGLNEQAAREMSEGLEMMKRVPVPDYGPMALRYIDLAMLYDSMGNQEQVEAVLKEMDSMTEGELAVGLARARIRLKHSDKEGAARILRDLLERYPSSLVLNPLGNLEFDKKHYAQALDDYQRAGGGWYLDAPMHVSMAKALAGMGRNKEAIDQCRLAEVMAPRDLKVRFECTEVRNAVASSGS